MALLKLYIFVDLNYPLFIGMIVDEGYPILDVIAHMVCAPFIFW